MRIGKRIAAKYGTVPVVFIEVQHAGPSSAEDDIVRSRTTSEGN